MPAGPQSLDRKHSEPRPPAEIVQWLLQQHHHQKTVRSCPNDTTAAPHLLASTEIPHPSSQRRLSGCVPYPRAFCYTQWRNDEATLGILRELTTVDLRACQIVIKRRSTMLAPTYDTWRRLASDNLSFLFDCMPQLTSLDLRSSPDGDAFDQEHREEILNTGLMEAIGKLTSLQVLRVGAVGNARLSRQDCLAELAGALKSLTRLTELKLTVGVHCTRTNEELLGAKRGGHELLETIGSLRALRILHMDVQISDNFTRHSSAIARSLAGALSGLKQLADLSLQRHKFCPEGAMTLVNVLQSLPALTHLSMAEVPAGIGGLTALQEIDLWCEDLYELPAELGALVELQKINLSACESLIKLPVEIGSLTALREIDLSWCGRLKELPAELGALVELQKINLSGCQHPEFQELTVRVCDFIQLETLDLSNTNLRTLPREVGQLTRLRTLKLDKNTVEELPAIVCDLIQLETLDAGNNNLRMLPRELGQLTRLLTLNLYGNSLEELSATVCDLIQLETLDLSNNNLRMLPREVGQLTRLRTLKLNKNKVEELPATVCDLIQLETLDLSNNNVRMLPREVGQLTRLRTLNLCVNSLEELSATVCDLIQLETLDVGNNNLRTLPHEVGQLTRLDKLNVRNNPLEALPVELLSICGLEMQLDTKTVQALTVVLENAITTFDLTLCLQCTVTSALPTALQVTGHGFWFEQQNRVLAFSQCDKVEDLDLRHNFLRVLPAKVLELLHLVTLDLSNNNLRTLPREVGQLTRLRTLKLDKNKVEELPATVCDLIQLETLDLSNNNLRTLPREVGQLTRLRRLNLDDNSLEKLPIVEIISNTTLDWLGCKCNKRLSSPPPEIANQGGEAVVRYLRLASPQAGGILNRDVELFMVGNGESGKTSVLAMLKKGKAERIHEDQRTVGINMMDLDLSDEAEGLVFRTKDLAGQLVYDLSNQFFLVNRALYILVWRIVPGSRRGGGHESKSGKVGGESVSGKRTSEVAKEMVSTWLDNLQVRVPGASVLLVATHVDVATQDEVEKQCRVVQTTVENKINELKEDEKVTGIPSLSVWAEGSSFRVNCLEGTGASDLKGALIHMAHSLPCWGECIPRSVVLLKGKIEEHVKLQGKPWIFWEVYAQMARECGVDDCVYLQIVTRFLHDNAVLKFFGKLPSRKVETVSDAVYIDPKWIMDTLKGLIRHNRQPLFDFFQSEKTLGTAARSKWKRRIYRLVSLGVLHTELIPFLWPNGGMSELSTQYWTWARANSQEEVDLWPRTVALTADDYARVVALLTGFDVMQLVEKDEYFAPALCPENRQQMDARAFARSDCDVHKRVLMTPHPLSFFAKLVVKVWSERLYSHVDFSPTRAAFYGRGLKAQIFWLCKNIEVVHQDGSHSRRSVVQLDVCTSIRRHMDLIEKQLEELFGFFPGVSGVGPQKASDSFILLTTPRLEGVVEMSTTGHESIQEPIQVEIIAATQKPAAASVFGGGAPPRPSSIEEMRDLILTVDTEGRDSKDVLNIKIGSRDRWTESYTNHLRVVIIAMCPNISFDPIAMAQFCAAITAGLTIIPVLMEGYDDKLDFARWWPENMRDLSKHSICVDMRKRGVWENKVRGELYPQIIKFLTEWRGTVPNPIAFEEAADRIVCFHCNDEGEANPHVFSRSDCESKLQAARAEVNKMNAEGQDNGSQSPDHSALLQEKCGHGHVASLDEILSTKVILEAQPCPCCIQNGRSPPFLFNRRKCLLLFTETMLTTSRAGSINCPYCQVGIRILDIVVPEVFFSYNWGFNLSTQKLVKPLRDGIEEESEVVVWLDVGGGMGPGQSANEEMFKGVSRSTVVVIFLSDAYCQSGNCIREYHHAVRHCKFLIPVLVPNKGPVRPNGPSSGWTGPGPGDQNWFQHAATISNKYNTKDPDTGDSVLWQALQSFEPIDLRPVNMDDEKRVIEEVILEMVKRIRSRMHRGRRIQHTQQSSGPEHVRTPREEQRLSASELIDSQLTLQGQVSSEMTEACLNLASEARLDSPTSDWSAHDLITALRDIVRVTRLHRGKQKDASFLCLAFSALSNIADAGEESQNLIADLEGVPLVIAAMEAHKNNFQVQLWACVTLQNIAYQNAYTKTAIANAFGVERILSAMDTAVRHKKEARVQLAACQVLLTLSSEKALRSRILEADGLRRVRLAMAASEGTDTGQEILRIAHLLLLRLE
jgi:Leucine-rich repeat (LRR) protein